MKVAIICDTHIGARSDSELFLEHQQKFFEKVFFPYLKQHNITTLIDLGDTFDRRKFINFKTLESSKRFLFDPLQEANITTHILVGNHSTFFKNTNRVNSPDLLLREYKNITVYTGPQDIEMGGAKLAIVPWITTENYDEVFSFIKNTPARVCLGHFEFAGFETIRGVTHEEGITTEEFKKFNKVLTGHFHYKQDNGHIYYLGCPYEMIWTATPEEKGFHIFDTETFELEFIKNPYTMFKRVRYSDGPDETPISELKNCYVKIFVNKKTDPYAFDVYLDQVFAVQPAHVTIIEDFIINDGDGVTDTNILVSDTLGLLSSYIDKMEGVPDKDNLKRIASQIYTEAMSNQD